MAIDKLIPQYLNLDDDERILKSYEMVNALNVRISHEEDGDAGVIKNVEGNQAVAAKSTADAIPSSGTNKVIGAVASEAHKCIYFFLYNSNGNHGIYRYIAAPGTEDSDVYEKVYENSVLNFNMQSFVKADLVVNQNGEHLLYFTDNRNEPRKINATKALSGSYSDTINSGSSYEKNLFLSVCKQPPLAPPTFQFKSNPSLKRNQLTDAMFQFAYQYVYDDGEVSALSPYSKIAVSSTHLAFNNAQKNIYESQNNEIEVELDCSPGPVKKIRLYARRGNGGYFVKVDELDNIQQADTSIISVFRNDGLYNQLDENSANKPFDSVPRLAASQTFSNNRLFYGNYVEGFDNVATESIQYPVYYSIVEDNDVFVEPRTRFSLGPGLSGGVTEEYRGTSMIIGSRFEDFYQANQYLSLPQGQLNDCQQSFSGKPIGVEIDLSNIPESGVDRDAVLSISFSIDGSAIGFAQINETDANYDAEAFDVPISLRDDTGLAVNHAELSDSIAVLQGTKQFSAYNYQREGSLNNMQLMGGFDFGVEVPVAAGTTRTELLGIASEAISNSNPVVVGVASKLSEPGVMSDITTEFDGVPLSIKNMVERGVDQCSENIYQPDGLTLPDDINKDWIAIQWSGTFTFVPDSFVQGSSVFVRFTNQDINLQAVRAITVARAWLPNDKYQNALDGVFVEGGHTYQAGEIDCTLKTGQNTSITSGYPLKDGDYGDISYCTAVRDMSVSGSGALILSEEGVVNNKSFKSGASHDFGVVYFDDRNRSCGVQKLGAVDVARTGDIRRSGNQGRVEIDIRLLHEPPSWAHRWAPVYSKNTTYDSFIQFTVSEALLPNLTLFRDILSPAAIEEEDSLKNSRAVSSALGDDIRTAIFLSMRPLEGKNNSYKEFKGGQNQYQFVEGDIMRVVSYVDSTGQTQYPNNKEFTVTGYSYFVDNEENPLVVSETSDGNESEQDDVYRRTGWFLSIRDNNQGGFSRADVSLSRDLFSQACVIEILRPKKGVSSPVYYEIGESYPIEKVSNVRTHGGDRSNGTISGISINVLSENFFFSQTRMYVGDKLNVFDGGNPAANTNGYVFIGKVIPSPGGYKYYVDNSNTFRSNVIGLTYAYCSIASTPNSYNSSHYGVVTLNDGDVYLRNREMLVNAKQTYSPTSSSNTTFSYSPILPRKQDYKRFEIEDASASDFFESKELSIGRSHIETPDQARIRRTTSITYSDPFAFDSSQLNLSSFNPVLFPYYDLPSKHGEITYIIDGNESLTVLQESKVSLLPINRNVVEFGGESNMVASTDVIGTPTFMAGSYGPGNSPESVVERFGRVYFSDVRSGVVCKIDGGGIVPISGEKMESYFEGLFGAVNNAVAVPKIPSGFDPENSEYIITTEPIDFVKLSINNSTVGFAAEPNAGSTYADIKVTPKFATEMLLSWGTEPLDWDESEWVADNAEEDVNNCIPKWDDTHNGVIYLDRVNETSGVYLHPDLEGSTGSIRVDTIVQNKLYRGSAMLSMSDYSVDFCLTLMETDEDGGTQLLSLADAVPLDQATVAWSPNAEKWLTFYSFVPELYANVQNRFFSFKDGKMWYHNKLSTRNSFYEVGEDLSKRYSSKLTLISKGNPSSIKFYKALSLEGSKWDLSLINDKQKVVDIDSSHLKNKEGLFYANIPRVGDNDIDLTGTQLSPSNYRVIGTVASVDSNSITFNGDIDKMPVMTNGSSLLMYFRDGNPSWSPVGASINSVANKNTVTTSINTSSTIQAGDIIANVFLGGVDGESFRSYYAKIEMESDSTDAIELYALNLVYEPSSLHNDGGQPNNQ